MKQEELFDSNEYGRRIEKADIGDFRIGIDSMSVGATKYQTFKEA